MFDAPDVFHEFSGKNHPLMAIYLQSQYEWAQKAENKKIEEDMLEEWTSLVRNANKVTQSEDGADAGKLLIVSADSEKKPQGSRSIFLIEIMF